MKRALLFIYVAKDIAGSVRQLCVWRGQNDA